MKWSACVIGAAVLAHAAAAAPRAERSLPPNDAMAQRIDTIVARQLAQHHIAGATVAVVQDNKLIFAKGSGYADATRRVPVVADQTLFRIGSVSKIFTTVATMQLAEAGKLRLDTDIGRYLDFTIPRVSAKPVTLAHLMTHTAGFAESLDGLLVKAPRDVLPVGTLVKRTLPPLVRAPGAAPSYSTRSYSRAISSSAPWANASRTMSIATSCGHSACATAVHASRCRPRLPPNSRMRMYTKTVGWCRNLSS